MNSHAKWNLHLFTLIPDGDYLFPIKRILDQLGCPCKDDKSKKTFYKCIDGQNFSDILLLQSFLLSLYP